LPEIQNPNLQAPGSGGGKGSGGGMSSMLFFTMVALAVLLGYQYFFQPKPTPPATQPQSQAAQAPQSAAAASPAQPQLAAGAVQTATTTPAITAAAETLTTVENAHYKIVFSNKGAQVKQWILKNYKDSAGKALDMVQPQAAAKFGLPLSFYTYEPALTTQLNESLYQASATGYVQAPNTLTFHYAANGLDVIKTFRFDTSFVITVETQVMRNGAPVRALVAWPSALGDMEEFLPSSKTRNTVLTPTEFIWSIDGKQDTTKSAKVGGNATLEQPYEYAAITDLYFATAFLPDVPSRTSVVTLHHTIDVPSDLTDPNSKKRPADVLGLAMGDQSGYTRLRLFAGPKEMDVLNSVHAIGSDGKPSGQALSPLIQLGFWTFIAKPLYIALRFLYEHGVPNWGWAIIIFTVLFNLLLLPTRVMMMKSSLKMMRIQPKVEALKKRYAHLKMNDPKRAEMNTEMMALYKTEGVNMYGGCLPLLLQMPLFFAYYKVLANVIELRQAHWYWLTDLSSPDPWHILPAIIIVSMFLIQFITPSPGMDPAQRRMMAVLMPVIFGFSMLHFASGLALYWGTGNVINLGLQIAINQSKMGKEIREIGLKRAARKGGTHPRTITARR
jgi:YidC/Oxa1 family membrane protein insertase